MEPNYLPVIAKRFWNVVRAALFMIKQGISKKKLMLDLNLKLKRGKLSSGKSAAVRNLIFHHYHHHSAAAKDAKLPASVFADPSDAFEFSCENSPAHHHSAAGGSGSCVLHLPNLNYLNIVFKKLNKHLRLSAAAFSHVPPPTEEEIMTAAEEIVLHSVMASPALPGFGMTPVARQLRVTDSPFPLRDGGDAEFSEVDEAAEKFISWFRDELRQQNIE